MSPYLSFVSSSFSSAQSPSSDEVAESIGRVNSRKMHCLPSTRYKIEPFIYGMVALSTGLHSIITCGYARASPDIYLYVLEVCVRDFEWVH